VILAHSYLLVIRISLRASPVTSLQIKLNESHNTGKSEARTVQKKRQHVNKTQKGRKKTKVDETAISAFWHRTQV
jgi:hypothetical protein